MTFGSLSAARRRHEFRYLAETPEASLRDLAASVATLENDLEVPDLTSRQRKRVCVSLYWRHLPKLDDANVVDFEDSRWTVSLGPAAEDLYVHLSVAPVEPTSTHRDGGGSLSERFVGFLGERLP